MDWELFRPSRATAVCFFLLLFSFLLMAFRLTRTVQSLRAFLFYWVSPSYESVSSTLHAASGLGVRLGELMQAHQENIVLKEKVQRVFLIDSQLKETLAENERLKNLMELKSSLPFETIPAQITSRDTQNWTSAVWIDRGTKDGIEPDCPVVAVEGHPVKDVLVTGGVVGRVLECGLYSSKVLLISDPLSSIAVTLPRNGEQGLAQGEGATGVMIEYLNKSAAFLVGDEVSTSGLGGIFPAGLPVGKLSKVILTQSGFIRAELEPKVSLGRIRDVLVLKPQKPAERP